MRMTALKRAVETSYSESLHFVCAVCKGGSPSIFQRQNLELAGIGNVHLEFGYCRVCGHVCQTRGASPEQLRRTYAEFSNYAYFDDDRIKDVQDGAASRLYDIAASVFDKPGKVYEVGCSYGMHLIRFKENGWDVSGCDLSPTSAKEAKKFYGIEIDTGDEAGILPERRGYDLIYLSHVLEHVPYPLPTMRRVWRALRDNGYAMFEVPLMAEPDILPPGLFQLEHLHYFSVRGAERVMREAGFEIVKRITAYKFGLPVVTILGRKQYGVPELQDDIRDDVSETERFLARYLSKEDSIWKSVAERLKGINGKTYIWGAGVHTAQLFDRVPSLRKHVVAIVDRSSMKWGQWQAGFPVIRPEEFYASKGGRLVISSYAYEKEIHQDALAHGVEASRIVKLYT